MRIAWFFSYRQKEIIDKIYNLYEEDFVSVAIDDYYNTFSKRLLQQQEKYMKCLKEKHNEN